MIVSQYDFTVISLKPHHTGCSRMSFTLYTHVGMDGRLVAWWASTLSARLQPLSFRSTQYKYHRPPLSIHRISHPNGQHYHQSLCIHSGGEPLYLLPSCTWCLPGAYSHWELECRYDLQPVRSHTSILQGNTYSHKHNHLCIVVNAKHLRNYFVADT